MSSHHAFRQVIGTWLTAATALLLVLATAMTLLIGGAPSSVAAAGEDRLRPRERLDPGRSIAAAGNSFVMQHDGNLVMYGPLGVPLWASNTFRGGSWAVMQDDGNLVVYWNDRGVVRAAWGSGTNGRGVSTLVMQGDGNVVIYGPAGPTWSTNTYKQAYALTRFPGYGWGAEQWPCLRDLWARESNWNELARNPASGAYGIPQAFPADKMASQGGDWRTNPQTQIRWGVEYIRTTRTYTTPCRAWSLWLSRSPHWY
jgi:hypothetical protein